MEENSFNFLRILRPRDGSESPLTGLLAKSNVRCLLEMLANYLVSPCAPRKEGAASLKRRCLTRI